MRCRKDRSRFATWNSASARSREALDLVEGALDSSLHFTPVDRLAALAERIRVLLLEDVGFSGPLRRIHFAAGS
jgi:hypothetical protein